MTNRPKQNSARSFLLGVFSLALFSMNLIGRLAMTSEIKVPVVEKEVRVLREQVIDISGMAQTWFRKMT